ncbi:MAG: YabP/YqfC family sporulation protein [Bacilli bacterium]
MFKDLKNIIYDKKFKVTILKNQININSYKEIMIFEENQILVSTEEYLVKVKGENLTIIRLLENELLIEGKIKSVEFG